MTDSRYDRECGNFNENKIHINIEGVGRDDNGNKGNVTPSAFSAIGITNQNLTNAAEKVNIYGEELFDLNNEYNKDVSAFIPKENGIYSIIASVGIEPINLNTAYDAAVIIRVNGRNTVLDEEDAIGITTVDVSGILQLRANDVVEVFALATIPAQAKNFTNSSYFQGARLF